MSAMRSAVRTGLRRGWTEFRQILVTPEEMVFDAMMAGVVLLVLYFLRDNQVEGTSVSVATLALPGVVGMFVAYNATSAAAFTTAFEREDGTLLRARAAPYGVVGYVAGQIVRIPLATVLITLLVLVPGLLLFDGFGDFGIGGWVTVLWVLVLGLLATVPLGLVLGSIGSNPRSLAGVLFFVSGGLVAISGVFYPISALPGWLHPIAQVFPYYWLGLGMRSGMLPDEAASVELTDSWRSLETATVLGLWAVVGLALAPVLLRRAARRVSGASVEVGRLKAAQRIG
jgi:ABC-2 type transport system permease protein